MPDACELPRVRRAVVPLMRAGHALVWELVTDRLPGFAAVVRALNHLPEPRRALRRVEPIGIRRRSLHVVNLPAAEMRPADIPFVPLAVGRQEECAFPRADQYTYAAHQPLLARRCPRPARCIVDRERTGSTLRRRRSRVLQKRRSYSRYW